jgi:thioredoxin-like negative regulator of GroEL
MSEAIALAELEGVRGIPFVRLVLGGQPVAQAVGAQPKSAAEAALAMNAALPLAERAA